VQAGGIRLFDRTFREGVSTDATGVALQTHADFRHRVDLPATSLSKASSLALDTLQHIRHQNLYLIRRNHADESDQHPENESELPMAKVLLADDDPLLHKVLGFKLAQLQWELVSALDGEEALRMAKSTAPDVIVLDGMMPVKDGCAALRELRNDPATSRTPVIMLSAKNREQDVVGALDEGANDYLTKPFSPAELMARLAKLVPQPRA